MYFRYYVFEIKTVNKTPNVNVYGGIPLFIHVVLQYCSETATTTVYNQNRRKDSHQINMSR